MLEKKELILEGKKFILNKFPAVEGLEIALKFIHNSSEKFKDLESTIETLYKALTHVSIMINDVAIPLNNKTLINNHALNWEILARIAIAIIEYNCSFLPVGVISNAFDKVLEMLPHLTSKMSEELSDHLLQIKKQL